MEGNERGGGSWSLRGGKRGLAKGERRVERPSGDHGREGVLCGRERSVCGAEGMRLFQGGEGRCKGRGPGSSSKGGLVQRPRRQVGNRAPGEAGEGPVTEEVLKDYNGLLAAPAPVPALQPLPPPLSPPRPPPPRPAGVPQETFSEAAASPGKLVPLTCPAPSLGPTALPQSKQPAPSTLHETLETFSSLSAFSFCSDSIAPFVARTHQAR